MLFVSFKYKGGGSSALFITVILPLAIYVVATALIFSAVKKRLLWRIAEEIRVAAKVIDKRVIDGPIQRDGFFLMTGSTQKSVAPGGFLLTFESDDDMVINLLVSPSIYEQHPRGSIGTLTYKQEGKQLKFVSFK